MSLESDATYENGVLRPDAPLPLQDHQRVHLIVEETTSRVKRNYGLMKWSGSADELEALLSDPDQGLWGS